MKNHDYMKERSLLSLNIGLYILYFIISGGLIFSKKKEISEKYIKEKSVKKFYSEETGCDRAIVIDKPLEGLKARINIIEQAKETIEVSYYSIIEGVAADIFLSLLLEKANEGIKVRILLDGFFHGLVKNYKAIIYIISYHPNMELKLYEPINYLKPWIANNRLHDKYIIVDNKMLIIGGRNIGDRFLFTDNLNKITYDRDVFIINSKVNSEKSIIYELKNYFEYVYNHRFSKNAFVKVSPKRKKLAEEKRFELMNKLKEYRQTYKKYFNNNIQWYKDSYETNKISLIHNPIDRFKEPWCLYEILTILENSNKSIFIQTPYLVMDKRMREYFLNFKIKNNLDISILTNSKVSTPNLLAYSRYLKYRNKIANLDVNLYEYQSKNSIHAKTITIDDDISIIGSFNIDPRSAFLSTETMVVIQSKAVKKQLDNIIDFYKKESLIVGKNGQYLKGEVNEIKVSKLKNITMNILTVIEGVIEYLL